MNAKKKETETPVALKRDMKAEKIVVPDPRVTGRANLTPIASRVLFISYGYKFNSSNNDSRGM